MLSKSNAFLMLFIFAFGCFIGNRFKGSDRPPKASQEQNQAQAQKANQESSQDCSVEVGKKTNPDGSIEDFFRFRALNKANQGQDQSQAQAQKQEIKENEPFLTIFGGGGFSSKIQGWGSVEAITGRHSFEYLSNGPEHIGLYKVKILSF
jgi:hypothetical protein